MKKTLLSCLCFFSVFTCLAYTCPINTRLGEETESAYFANDCLVWKQQHLAAIDVGKLDEIDLPPPHLVVPQHDDKPPLAGIVHPSLVKHELTGDITVSINPVQNQCFVCKDMPFVLIASVTNTADNMSVAGATYNWYYVQADGTRVPIVDNPPQITIIGNTITFLKGNISLTTTPPYGATAYSVLDNFPGLSDVVSAGQNALSTTANNLMPDFTKTPFSQIKTAIDGILPQTIKDEIANAAVKTAKDNIKGLIPLAIRDGVANEFLVPIGVDVVVGAETVSATPFTRPAFDRPHAATYTVGPLTCCEGEEITFNNIDTNNPDLPTVMYMWVGFPGTPDFSGGIGIILNISKYIVKGTFEDAGLGNAFLLNPSKAFTQQGPVSITMGNRFAYTGNYTLMAFRGAPSPAGCSSFAKPTKVNVYGKPTSDKNTKLKTSQADNTFCEGDDVKIESNGSGISDVLLGAITYEWYYNNTLISTSENLTINKATLAAAGIYKRVAKTDKGCKTAATITINVTPKPATPAGLTSNSPICAGDDLTLSVTAIQNAENYIWTYPDNISGKSLKTIETTEPNTKINNAKAGEYRVQVKKVGGCKSDAATITVDIHKQFDASTVKITSNSPVLEGMPLSLSATLVPDAIYAWKGPNNFTSKEQSPKVNDYATPSMGGSYVLNVIKGKCSYTDSTKVEVGDKSVLDITNTDLTRTICSEDGIDIALSSNYKGTTYKWTAVGTGNITGYSQNSKRDVLKLSEKLTNNGTASGAVTCTVTPIFYDGTKEIQGNPKDFVVTVVPIKSAPFSDKTYSMKNYGYIDYKINPPNPPTSSVTVTYNWYSDPNKTTFLSSCIENNPFWIFTRTPGNYTFYVTGKALGDPCESKPAKLEFNVEHEIALSFDHSMITQGGSAVLTASLSGVTAPTGGITITLRHTPSSFAISPSIYIPEGSSSAFITIVTTKSLIMVDDEKIGFTGTKADPYTIIVPSDLMIKKDHSFSTITLKFNQASVNGGEHATLTAKLPDGILATQPIAIWLEPDEDHSTAQEYENYKNLETSITIDAGANSKTIEAFTAKNNGVIDGLTHLVLEATAPRGYSIANPNPKIGISDTTGDDPANRTIALAFQKPSVIGGDTNNLMISLPKGIVSVNNIIVTLSKDPNAGKDAFRAKENIDYKSFPEKIEIRAFHNSATYLLTTIGNEKVSKITTLAISGTALGYKFKSLAKVNIISGLHVPNVFTPGGVGDHPTWVIMGLYHYPNCDVKVFNRYGQIVFKSHGYAEPWNGGYENNLGKEMPVGTYYYVIELNDSRAVKRVLKGHVAIIR